MPIQFLPWFDNFFLSDKYIKFVFLVPWKSRENIRNTGKSGNFLIAKSGNLELYIHS